MASALLFVGLAALVMSVRGLVLQLDSAASRDDRDRDLRNGMRWAFLAVAGVTLSLLLQCGFIPLKHVG